MTLAKEVAHTVDVDAMLDSIEPQQFDEWVAYYKIVGLLDTGEENSLEQSLKTFRGLAGV